MALKDPQIGRLNEGDLYLREWVNGVLSADVMGPLSGTLMGIKTDAETKQNISKGRGTYGKPWLIKQIMHYLEHKEVLPDPSLEEMKNTIISQKISLKKQKRMKSPILWEKQR